MKAVKLYASDTAVLDDGFQHWELKRDLDIVLVDSGNPFGNSQLFPRGILREPKEALKRADIIVFTKSDKQGITLEALKKEVRTMNGNALFAEAVHAPTQLYDNKTKKAYGLEYLRGKRSVIFSSIGDPDYFEDTVRGLGVDVIEHVRFPDHHDYRKADIEKLLQRCRERSFDILLTTEKDIVKLNRLGLYVGSYAVCVLAVRMDIVSGKEGIIDRLDRLYIG
jgi:tetraacyldisaccharide 4'-kinase